MYLTKTEFKYLQQKFKLEVVRKLYKSRFDVFTTVGVDGVSRQALWKRAGKVARRTQATLRNEGRGEACFSTYLEGGSLHLSCLLWVLSFAGPP